MKTYVAHVLHCNVCATASKQTLQLQAQQIAQQIAPQWGFTRCDWGFALQHRSTNCKKHLHVRFLLVQRWTLTLALSGKADSSSFILRRADSAGATLVVGREAEVA